MLGLATAIATLGLMLNSAGVIIGAMIVAPLMNPILALSYAAVTGRRRLLLDSSVMLLLGIAYTLAISYVIAFFLEADLTNTEILSRSTPTLLDLGIALAAGCAGTFARTRRSIANALPGVAIAVALVPPLCVTGIGLALSPEALLNLQYRGLETSFSLEQGAFVLFLTNLVAIIFCGGLVFLSQGYGSLRKASIGQTGVILLLLLIIQLLGFYPLQKRALEFDLIRSLRALAQERPEYFEAESTGFQVVEADKILLWISLRAPKGLFDGEEVRLIEARLSEDLHRPVEVVLRVTPYEVIDGTSPLASPPLEGKEME
ncbi:DUF389 domain-containing protein [Rubidibacter lacunae]|nr:DUF389 domain-containing protein [Rubidibacter lacunae]